MGGGGSPPPLHEKVWGFEKGRREEKARGGGARGSTVRHVPDTRLTGDAALGHCMALRE